MINSCPGSQKFKQPHPEDIKCPHCGEETEIWTDEFEVKCQKCKKIIKREGGQNCLDWCKSAKECVGEETYKDYLKAKKRR